MFVWNKEDLYGVLCKNIFLANLLGSQHLLEILQTSLAFKNNENVVKIGCFEKILPWRASIFFEMTEGYSLLFKNFDFLLIYLGIGIYMKYTTSHPLSKLVKMS